MIDRHRHCRAVLRLLKEYPVVAILGARQVGKTTLAMDVVRQWRGPGQRFDLEHPEDLARLADAVLALRSLRGLVVIDEVQRRPDLFPLLRVLADRRPLPARFLVLGSASPDLLRQSSETLAGRIAFYPLDGLDLEEVGSGALERLWLRGGLPPSFLAAGHASSFEWRKNFVRTFVERDLPQLGVTIPGATMGRFWAMLAHYHGQVWNSSAFASSFGVTDKTVRHYLDLLAGALVVQLLQPWHANIAKRQVKAPKIYFRDSGLLHALLDVRDQHDLDRHPKLGASWEGFALRQILTRLGAAPEECLFWAVHAGAEIDLLWVRGRRWWGFEVKRTSSPELTRSLRSAVELLGLYRAFLVHAGEATFPLGAPCDGARHAARAGRPPHSCRHCYGWRRGRQRAARLLGQACCRLRGSHDPVLPRRPLDSGELAWVVGDEHQVERQSAAIRASRSPIFRVIFASVGMKCDKNVRGFVAPSASPPGRERALGRRRVPRHEGQSRWYPFFSRRLAPGGSTSTSQSMPQHVKARRGLAEAGSKRRREGQAMAGGPPWPGGHASHHQRCR